MAAALFKQDVLQPESQSQPGHSLLDSKQEPESTPQSIHVDIKIERGHGDDEPDARSLVAEEEVNSTPSNVTDFKTRLRGFQYGSPMDSPLPRPSPLGAASIACTKRKTLHKPEDVAKPTPSPSPSKRHRPSSRYAPPATYAHLPCLNDTLAPDLICIFVGTNPGIRTATAGHAYAHPSNSFWKQLHSSGCTDVRLRPEQDVDLPRLYAMGNTNIVSRPSRDAGELSKVETAAGTPVLEAKIRALKPEAVCIVGKGIWEAVWRWRHGRAFRKGEFEWGWQHDAERMGKDEEWEGARVFVTSSTSGLSASLKPPEKEAIWKPFGEWVKGRRRERFGCEGRIVERIKGELKSDP